MSKIEESIINNIKMLSLDMIYKAGSGDAGIVFSGAHIFYNLFMNHLIFDPNNKDFINRDRLVVTNRLLPLLYATESLFYKDVNLDDLKDYKAFNAKYNGSKSLIKGGSIAKAVGVSLGREYLNGLVNIEQEKCHLVNFKTYCLCTLDELMPGLAYEAMSFAGNQQLNNLIFIVIKDEISKDSSNKETFKENLEDRFMALNYNVDIINSSASSLNGALDDAKNSKKCNIIIVNSPYGKSSSRENSNKYFNKPLAKEEMDKLRVTYKLDNPFTISSSIESEIRKNISKRLSKYLINYKSSLDKNSKDLKIKEIIDFLNLGKASLEFNGENIRIDDDYKEELLKSNNKILNVIASKSPFILCGSDDNFIYTLSSINKASVMSKDNRTGRNILFGERTLAMGGIFCGIASLGFKLFISTPLINESILKPFIKYSSLNNLDINFIFTHDSFINAYENNEYHAYDEIDDLRRMPNLITYRPADINEIIGTYNTLVKLGKSSAIILGNEITPKLSTNEKYVVAGAYRVKKEDGPLDGIIIASGGEVNIALTIAEELKEYNLVFRVVSMVSSSLFAIQSEKYRSMLLPFDVKTFTLEYSSGDCLSKYATGNEYVFAINNFYVGGTKEEKLNYYHLNKDAIKAKIIELLKK